MGKRKIHDGYFYQCDWTAFPMRAAHCYLPQWTSANKLVKKGSYCNWESVVAHAETLKVAGTLAQADVDQISDHIAELVGARVATAPHWKELAHMSTGGGLTATQFHWECCQAVDVMCVVLHPDGTVQEEVLDKGDAPGEKYMNPSATPITSFYSTRKVGKKAKGSDRELCVYHTPDRNLPHNLQASNLFKMQLFGTVLLVQKSREASFMPRERLVSFNMTDYTDHFSKKRKRPETAAYDTTAYKAVKKKMQETLNAFEAESASAAITPAAHSKALTMAPTSGKVLAAAMRARHKDLESASRAVPPAVAVLAS